MNDSEQPEDKNTKLIINMDKIETLSAVNFVFFESMSQPDSKYVFYHKITVLSYTPI